MRKLHPPEKGRYAMRRAVVPAGLLLLAISAASGQQSGSFTLEEHVFNAGGGPQSGAIPTSASFQITLDALGEGLVAAPMLSTSFQMEGGFGSAYPPPGEAENLRFTDATTLVWDAEPSRGDYALYQGLVAVPFDAGYGSCEQPPPVLAAETATVTALPGTGDVLFVLVTARNRLAEEGPKGFDHAGVERDNPVPCP